MKSPSTYIMLAGLVAILAMSFGVAAPILGMILGVGVGIYVLALFIEFLEEEDDEEDTENG